MNKNPTPKSDSAATPELVPAVAKPAPTVIKAAKAATAATPSKTAAATKARVGRPPAAKTAVVKKAAVRSSVKAAVAKAAAPAVKEKARKAKLVRDSFTMPEVEYAVLGKVKKASLKAGFNVRKSELLRIGVALVDQLSVAKLQAALAGLMPLKAGRPKKDK